MTDLTLVTPRMPPPVPSRIDDPEALIREARARQRRRCLRLAVFGLAAVAAAVGAAGLFGGPSSHALTVGEIMVRESAALKNASQRVVHVRTHQYPPPLVYASLGVSNVGCGGCNTEEWVDRAMGQIRIINYESDGHPSDQDTLRYLSNGRLVTSGGIFYQPRTWVTYIGPPPPSVGVTGPNAISTIELGPLGAPPGDNSWAYRLIGSQRVAGQPAYELQTRWPKGILSSMARDGASAVELRTDAARRFDVWISKSTYLPVRMQDREGTRLRSNIALAWLPPTRTNLALLKLDVPTGFKHSVERCRLDACFNP